MDESSLLTSGIARSSDVPMNMDPLQFACPHCNARLRVRDKLYVGRTVACPECRERLVVVQDQKRTGVTIERVAAVAPVEAPVGARSESHREAVISTDTSLGKQSSVGPPQLKIEKSAWWRRPLAIAGGVAALVVIILVIAIALHENAPDGSDSQADRSVSDGSRNPPVENPASDVTGIDSVKSEIELQVAESELSTALTPGDDADESPQAAMPPADAEDDAESDESPTAVAAVEPPPPVAPEQQRIEVARSLEQRIVRFDQPGTRTLAEVLTVVGEMLGSPIDLNRENLGALETRLDSPSPLKVEKTTLGEILNGLLKPAGLTYRIEANRIMLVPRE